MDKSFTFKVSGELMDRVKKQAGFQPVSDILRKLLEEWAKMQEKKSEKKS